MEINQVQEDIRIIRDYQLMSKFSKDIFLVVIEDSGNLTHEDNFQNIIAALREDYVNFLVKCNVVDPVGVENTLKIKKQKSQKCYLEITISLADDFEENVLKSLFQWSAEMNVPLLSLKIEFRTDFEIQAQKVSFEKFISCLEELIDPKINIMFDLVGERQSTLEMETWRLECVNELYEKGFTITRLALQVDSTAAEGKLTETWEEVIKVIRDLKVSYSGKLTFRQTNDEILDLSLFNEFLLAFPDEGCKLIVPNQGVGEFTDKIRTMIVNINGDPLSRCEYIPHIGKLTIDLGLDIFLKQILSFTNPKDLMALYINAYAENKQFRDLTGKEREIVSNTLRNMLVEYPILYLVLINETELRDFDEEFKKIETSFLEPKLPSFLEYLIQQKITTRYNRAKLIVVGDTRSGKTATIRALLDEDFEEEHRKTLVTASGVTLNPWRRLPNTYGNISDFATHMNYVIGPDNTMTLGIWEYGGDLKPLHPFFLNDDGIVMIVFDLESMCNELSHRTLEDTLDVNQELIQIRKLRKWMSYCSFYNSVGAHMLLVGTRARATELTDNNMKKVNEQIDAMLEDFYYEKIIFNQKRDLWFFPVENSLKNENTFYLKSIKDEINKVLLNEENHGPWNSKVNLSWMFFMKDLYSKSKDYLVSFESLREKAMARGFSKEESRQLIHFFADAGAILDFSDIIPEASKPSIVLSTGWMFRLLATLIQARNSPDLYKMKRRKNDGSRKLVPLLENHNILSTTLMANIFKSQGLSHVYMDLLVAICEKHLIYSRLDVLPENARVSLDLYRKNKFWIVPSLFPAEREGYIWNEGERRQAKVIKWSIRAPRELFYLFNSKLIKFCVRSGYLRVIDLSKGKLKASFKNTIFLIIYESNSRYLLHIPESEDEELKSTIYALVEQAYGAVFESLDGKEVAEVCEFYTPVGTDSH